MRGEFVGVWSETWRDIWLPLADREDIPQDVFAELYRELASALKIAPSAEEMAEIVASPTRSKEVFENCIADDLKGERSLVTFLDAAHTVLDDLGGDNLSNSYFNLLADFVEKFSLRYDLRRPCSLCPTLTGVFASLMRDLRALASQDEHLNTLMKEFEDAVRDLQRDRSDGKIKTCILKQINLLEAFGRACPGVTATELGAMSKEINTWPHKAIGASLRSLYGFASDYPGIRHGGNPDGALRAIEMRDMIAVSVLLVGFTPYLSAALDADIVYRGA